MPPKGKVGKARGAAARAHEKKKRKYTPAAHGDRQYPWRNGHQHTMAEFWRNHPIFYDKTQQHFKNKDMKKQLVQELIEQNREEWEKIHTPLPSVTQVDAHLRNIRTRFVKVMKRKSDAPELTLSYTDQKIYERYQFLCPHIQRKRKTTTTTTRTPGGDDEGDDDEDDDDDDDDDEDDDDDNDDDDDVQSLQGSQQPSTSHTHQYKGKGKGKHRGLLTSPIKSSLTYSEDMSEMEILQQAKNLISNIRSPTVSGHERRVRDFSRYMESEMLRIPESCWDECSFTIMDVIRGFKTAQHQSHLALSQQHPYQQNSHGHNNEHH
ncbi:SAGA-associated factor 73 [Kryptolebias marmoratus]|uniref:SAGA-associated factor 73 n=1 Tax=Kryptolebias marmoratus TaxID=37003 RepID=UPI0007F8FD9D|nr:SAGA-associated factor 73 [Kryptolebias marmoratus]